MRRRHIKPDEFANYFFAAKSRAASAAGEKSKIAVGGTSPFKAAVEVSMAT